MDKTPDERLKTGASNICKLTLKTFFLKTDLNYNQKKQNREEFTQVSFFFSDPVYL